MHNIREPLILESVCLEWAPHTVVKGLGQLWHEIVTVCSLVTQASSRGGFVSCISLKITEWYGVKFIRSDVS